VANVRLRVPRDARGGQPAYNFETDGVTQSLLDTFMRCRKASFWTLNRWQSRRISMPILFGNLFHYASEWYYDRQVKGKKAKLSTAVQIAIERNEEDLLPLKNAGPGIWYLEAEKELERAEAVLEVLFPAYIDHYAKKSKRIVWEAAEHEFNVPVEFKHPRLGVPVRTRLRGKLDGVFYVKKNLWINDIKTKSRLEEPYLLDLLTLDLQVSFYVMVAEIKYGTKLAGFQYDMVRRPELRLTQRETLSQYQQRIADDIKKRPVHYFKRPPITLNNEDRARFRGDLIELLAEFYDWKEGLVPTYHRTCSCMTRYGPCRFLPLCARGDFTQFTQRNKFFPELEE